MAGVEGLRGVPDVREGRSDELEVALQVGLRPLRALRSAEPAELGLDGVSGGGCVELGQAS
jgi:hypothetical protein